MLSMKSLYSPLAIAFQTSHENLNSYHRVLGRIIYLLLLFHTLFYLNFFIQSGILLKRLSAFVVILGVLAFFLLNVLSTTALSSVRRWSYRVFFILHLTIGVTMLPILFFHAAPLRLYVLEALVLFVLDIIARRLNTITAFSVITAIPQTKLIKLTVPIPTSRIGRFKKAAGQHVYLSIPPQSTQTKPPLPSIHDILFNPFTVAEVSSTSITLILRIHNGPTTSALEHLTHLPKAHPPMNIEGPYGSARKFPNFATNYDRILLIAGGVGASFIVPTYRKIEETLASEQLPADKVNFIWTTRSIAETPWALAEDANVKIYTTGKGPRRGGGSSQTGDNEVGVELEGVGKPSDIQFKGRPDFRSIVDETFRHNDAQKVAILVCGPDGMGNEVRKHVGRWVGKGREVFWHDETFGW
jgi:NAD(P)H-flavin reductase